MEIRGSVSLRSIKRFVGWIKNRRRKRDEKVDTYIPQKPLSDIEVDQWKDRRNRKRLKK